MASYDSADLNQRVFKLVKRPASDETLSTTDVYGLLTDAQNALYEDIAARAPNALTSAPTAMSTADGGHTFTFGTNADGSPMIPMGNTLIYPALVNVPNSPWQKGYDFLDEGSQIRIPNNGTYSGTLYFRGVIPPNPISAGSQPTFQPASDRLLLVYWAAAEYAEQGDLRDSTTYRAKYTAGLSRLLLRIKRGLSPNASAFVPLASASLSLDG